jgi:hypothetical protein
MREFFAVVAGFLLLVIFVVGIAVLGDFYDLWFLPYRQHMETQITRNSNGYVTAQQEALRQFRTDYDQAQTDGQKANIVQQMREIADKIPGLVQPDISAFVATH